MFNFSIELYYKYNCFCYQRCVSTLRLTDYLIKTAGFHHFISHLTAFLPRKNYQYYALLQDYYHKIFEDIFKEFGDFEQLKVNIFSSQTFRHRRYFIVQLPSNLGLVNDTISISLYKYHNVLSLIESCCIVNNLDVPSLENLSWSFPKTTLNGKFVKTTETKYLSSLMN